MNLIRASSTYYLPTAIFELLLFTFAFILYPLSLYNSLVLKTIDEVG